MFWKDKRVLISGGTGFIGKNLVQRLLREEAEPIAFGSSICDLSQDDMVKDYFSKHSDIDFIFHLATYQKTGNVQYEIKGDQFYINTRMNFNLLNAWRDYLPEAKLVSVGCSCSYPEKDTLLCEDDYWNGKLHDSVESYGFAKKLTQVGQKAYSAQFNLKSLYVVLSTLYGPYDNYEEGQSHFIAALIKRISDAGTNNLPEVEIWGDGSQVRECLYMDDQIDALLIAAEKLDMGLINIGATNECTVKQIAETIKEVVGYRGELVYNPDKFTGVHYKVMDSSRFKGLTGWVPTETLYSGIEKTVSKWLELSQEK